MDTLYDMWNLRSKDEYKGFTFIKRMHDEDRMSYKKMYDQSVKILGYLQKNELVSGDELIIQIDESETFIGLFWACILGGIIPVPVSVGSGQEHKNKLLKIFEILRRPHIISNEKVFQSLVEYANTSSRGELASKIRQRALFVENIESDQENGVQNAVQSEDQIAFIQFSSGTTGDPKGVVLTHANVLANIRALNSAFKTTSSDSALSWLPLSHDMGLICFHLTCTLAGIEQYIMPTSSFIRRSSIWLQKTHDYRITQLYSPNFGYNFFLNNLDSNFENWDLSCVRLIVNGAEPISASISNRFLKEMGTFGLDPRSMTPAYGLAEATVGVAVSEVEEMYSFFCVDRNSIGLGQKVTETAVSDDSLILVSSGKPIANCEVRICDELDRQCPQGTVGLIQIRGDNVASGYYHNLEETKNLITTDGWSRTGDMGFMRNDDLIVTGRVKELIIINGQNYYPYDIERICERVEGIEPGDVAACGIFLEEIGTEKILLFVRYKKTIEDFQNICEKIIREVSGKLGLEIHQIVRVKQIPKTTSGKIQRSKMKELFLKDSSIGKLEAEKVSFT